MQDFIFFSLSYLKNNLNIDYTSKAENIFENILNEEKKNEMPQDIIESSIKKFCLRIEKIDWQTYYLNLPFNESCLALYDWSPVADELKTLDKKIVLNSISLKWGLAKNEFKKLTKNLNFD